MATTLASLVVRVGADVSGVTAGLNTVQKRTRKLKKQFSSITDSTLTLRGAMGVLAGATGLALAGKKVFDLGASVEETASKFNTVFGPAVHDAQRFLDEFATSAGLSETQGRELLATTGAITQGLGFTQEASAGVSEQIIRMAADIASFNNTQGGAERVAKAMISALNGETEALKESAKVVVLQADVMDKAAEMTGKATKEITRQDKALATLALISERAGVAMGDLGRTMDSPANRARKLHAEFLTLRDDIAHGLLPAMGVFLGEIGKLGGAEGFTGLGDKVKENSSVIAAWAKFTIEAMKFVAMSMAGVFRIAFNLGQVIGTVLKASFQVLTGNVDGARETLGALSRDFGDMKSAVGNIVDSFEDMQIASGAAWQTMGGVAGETKDLAKVLPDAADSTRDLADSTRDLAAGSEMVSVMLERLKRNMRRATDVVREGASITLAMRTENEVFADTVERLNVLLEAGAISWTTYFRAIREGLSGITKDVDVAEEQMDVLAVQMQYTASQGVDAFVDFAAGASGAISSFVKRALSDLAKLAARFAIFRALSSIFPTSNFVGGLGQMWGFEGRALGGPVTAGTPYVVGESGPELFMPAQSGTIVPNGGGQMSSALQAALASVPNVPMTPEAYAYTDYFRRVFSAATADGRARGLR